MNARLVRQFLAIADTGSFRKAAEQLHMSQPPLSAAIQRLEAELGGKLFVRERRGTRLTPLGEAIVDDARQIAFHEDQLRKSANNATIGFSGVLRIGFIGSATYTLLPRALPVFRRRYPLVMLELHERTTSQIMADVAQGSLDLGLVRYPAMEPTSTLLTPVEPDALVAALEAGHPLLSRGRLKLQDLADEPFIMYSAAAAPNLRAQVFLVCQAAGFSPRVAQEAVQVQTLLSLVGSGMGTALVPSVSGSTAPRNVVLRALDGRGNMSLSVAIAAVTRRGGESILVQRFRDVLLEVQRPPSPASSRPRVPRR